MEQKKHGISLENKLLASSKLRGPSLSLQSNFALVSKTSYGCPQKELAGPKVQSLNNSSSLGGMTASFSANLKNSKCLQMDSEKPQLAKNTLLTGSMNKELTQNKLLQRQNLLLSSGKVTKNSTSLLQNDGKGKTVPPKGPDLGAIGQLKSNLVLLSSKSSLGPGVLAGDLKGKENSSLRSNDLSKAAMKSSFAPSFSMKTQKPSIIRGWSLEKKTEFPDKIQIIDFDELEALDDEMQPRPVYELEFYEENFSKELSGRLTEINDFKGKNKGSRDPEAEKQMKHLQQVKVLHLIHLELYLLLQVLKKGSIGIRVPRKVITLPINRQLDIVYIKHVI